MYNSSIIDCVTLYCKHIFYYCTYILPSLLRIRILFSLELECAVYSFVYIFNYHRLHINVRYLGDKSHDDS